MVPPQEPTSLGVQCREEPCSWGEEKVRESCQNKTKAKGESEGFGSVSWAPPAAGGGAEVALGQCRRKTVGSRGVSTRLVRTGSKVACPLCPCFDATCFLTDVLGRVRV